MIPAMLVAVLLTVGTIIWLILLLSSTLFPPKRGSEMRLTEKSLLLVSALLLVLWVVIAMTYAAPA